VDVVIRRSYRRPLIALTCAASTFSLAQSVVVPALPAFRRDLHASTEWATWLFTAFLLTAAVSTPLAGKLGDQFGKRRLLLVLFVVFVVGTFGAIFAWNIWSLIAFRALQGCAGGVFPLSYGIVRDEFPPEKVAWAFGFISTAFAIGGGAGLLISGLCIDYLSWRWMFALLTLASVLSFLLVLLEVRESGVRTPSRLDVPGALLLSVGLATFLLGVTEGSHWGWSSVRVLGLFAASVVAFATWPVLELRVAEPLIDMRLFVHRPVLVVNVLMVILGLALVNTFILIPVLVEAPRGLPASVTHLVHYGFGASATQAGLIMLPQSLTITPGGMLSGPLGRRFGLRWPLAAGMLMLAGCALALSLWHAHPWQIGAAMAVYGFGFGLAFTAAMTVIAESVPANVMGVAGGITAIMRTVGLQIGAQIGAAILAGEVIAGTNVPAEGAFVAAFAISGALAVVGLVVSLVALPRGGRGVAAQLVAA
jgi:EmrB/QacA subfamily drug resistance transporter